MLYRGLLRGRTSGSEDTKTPTRALQEAIRIRPAIRGCFLDILPGSTPVGCLFLN